MASINNTPQAKDDAVAGAAGTTVVFDVLANDLGGNAKHLYSVNQAQPGAVATSGTSAMGATVTILGDKVSYAASGAAFNRLAAGQTAVDTFSYTIQMGNGALSVATVSVTVTGTNDAPVVTGTVTGTASGNAPVTLDAFGRASDADGGATLTVTGLPTLPAGVTYDAATHSFTLNGADASYSHLAAGQTQTITVSYGVTDGTATTPQTVSWTITGANDAPVVSAALTGAAAEGAAASTVNALAGASDVDDGATLSVTNVPATLPAGVTYDAATHSFTLDGANPAYNHLAAGQTEIVTVSFGVSDGAVTTPQTLTWTVTGANDAPTVTAALTGAAVEGAAPSTVDALSGASDVDDGTTLSVVNVPGILPAGVTYDAATHSFSLDGSDASYNHLADGQTETVTVSFGISDGTATTPQTVTWTVTGTNDAPTVAAALTGAVAEGGPALLINALAGASDVDDGTTLSVVNVPATLPAGVGYDPATHAFTFDTTNPAYNHLAAGQTETVTVSFGVSDGAATTPQTITWTVTGANDAPTVSAALTGAANEGGVTTVNALANASDADDGATLSVVNVPGTLPAGVSYDAATHSFTLDGANAAYDHLAAGQSTVVTVSYGVSDGTATTPQTLSWTVTGANDAPTVAAALTGAVAEGGPALLVNALANASDVDDGTTLSVVDVPAALPAGVGYDPVTHAFTFDTANPAYNHLAAGQTETVAVSFGVSDGAATTPQTITWTVTGANDAPTVTAALTGAAAEGSAPSTVNALGGASDADDATTLSVVNVPATLPAGVSYDAATHSFTLDGANAAYDHLAAGQSTVVTVSYGVSDGTATTPQTLSWTVTGANDAPTVTSAVTGAVAEGATATLSALAGATDVDDGAVLSVTNVPAALPAGVTYDAATKSFSLDAANAAYNHLAAGATEVVSVTYGVSDGTATTSQTAKWTVTGVNDAPVVSGPLSVAATEGVASAAISAISNASDPDDGAVLQVVNHALPPAVTYDSATRSFALDAGHATFNNLAAGETRVVTVDYSISDGMVAAPTSISWTVTGTNDAPVVSSAIPDLQVGPHSAISYTVPAGAFTDVDAGATLTYSTNSLPSWLTFNAATRTFTGTPTLGNVGDYSVTVTAKDAANASASDTFVLKVVDAPFILGGGSAAETLTGGAFGDTISASLGADSINGGGGADNINADAGGVTGSTIGLGIPVSADLTSVAYGYLTRPGGTLVNGLGSVSGLAPAAGHPLATFGENVLLRDDDGYLQIPTSVLDDAFPDGLNFFNRFYNSLFVNNNGSVSFGTGVSSYSPQAFPVPGLAPQIAAYWADVDTRSTTPWAASAQTGLVNGVPVYGQAGHYSPDGNSTGSNRVYYDVDPVNHVLTITWDDVGVYNLGPAVGSQAGLQPNAFQMQIIDEGNGDFDVIFRYETVSWMMGQANASNNYPQVGFDSGDGVHYYQAPGSRTALMGDLETQTNTIPANPGVMQFYVRGGGVGYDDTITGGAGADTLEGGGGGDRFVFNFSNEGTDRISDFYSGIDEIAVSGMHFGLLPGAPVRFLSAADHATATLAGGSYFIFETATKTLWWDPTGGSGSDALSLAVLPGATLTGTDIVVF
jgi:VCBS repeat-containing protein